MGSALNGKRKRGREKGESEANCPSKVVIFLKTNIIRKNYSLKQIVSGIKDIIGLVCGSLGGHLHILGNNHVGCG